MRIADWDSTSMRQLELIEQGAPSGVPTYTFDWRKPGTAGTWRDEWHLVIEALKRKAGSAQDPQVHAMYETAWRLLNNTHYIVPNTTANIMARVVDCMEAHLEKGTDTFQAWVCTCIREAMHDVFRHEAVWLDPAYQTHGAPAL